MLSTVKTKKWPGKAHISERYKAEPRREETIIMPRQGRYMALPGGRKEGGGGKEREGKKRQRKQGNEKFEMVATYKERSMRNAITEHIQSYGGNADLTRIKIITDYNENTMRYFLTVNGDACFFAMLRESDGAKIEQR